jgi:hypothetical protein
VIVLGDGRCRLYAAIDPNTEQSLHVRPISREPQGQ